MSDLIEKNSWWYNEKKRIGISKLLIYFYVLLGAFDGALLLDLSTELIIFTATLSIFYVVLTVFLGWLMLRAISKNSKGAYIIPATLFLISLTAHVFVLGELEVTVSFIISLLELTILAGIFYIMLGNYRTFTKSEL